MFNFSGSEIIFLLLLALIILGPEKLPDAVRKFGKGYAEFKKVTTGFQQELKSALDEPMREIRETADAFKKAATFELDLDPNAPKPPTKQGDPVPAANGDRPQTQSGAEPPIAPAAPERPTAPPAAELPVEPTTASPHGDDLGASAG